MSKPEITVLMAVYNGMPYLPEAVESILGQTYDDFEFLIVNDCSTDDTREVILSYADPRVRLIDNDVNLRQTRSLNKGLEKARGRLVARMDDDDISSLDRLEKQVAFLNDHPDVAALGSDLRFIDTDGKPIGHWSFPAEDLALRWLQLFYNPISNGVVMFRREVIWDQLRGYNPEIIISQDWELWGRVLANQRIASLPEVLLDVRKHGAQETANASEQILKDSLAISRANAGNVLRVSEDDGAWVRDLSLLPHSAYERRRGKSRRFVAALERAYECYCALFPEARSSPEVRKILAFRFFEAAEDAGIKDLRTAFAAVCKAFPLFSRSLFLYCSFRWLLTLLGMKPRVLRKTSFYEKIYNWHSAFIHWIDRKSVV